MLALALLLGSVAVAISAGAGSRMMFGGKYSILVPEGWTAEISGDGARLDGTGPAERARFRAAVAKTSKSVEQMLETGEAEWSKKFLEFEMLDVDHIKSKSGMAGLLAYYRYSVPDKEGQVYVVQVIIKGAPSEVVILTYTFTGKKKATKEENPLKGDEDAVNAMYESLQLNE
jgi:hypothetical protein